MNAPTQFNAATLALDRCPHSSIENPLLSALHNFQTTNSAHREKRLWKVYVCSKCGGALLGAGYPKGQTTNPPIVEIYRKPEQRLEGLPEKASSLLNQAIGSVHAPSGAIMLCASSVDAMLKHKGYKDGSLYSRIENAATVGLITKEMSLWTHDVRLGANDERHADEQASLPNEADAKKCIEFTNALGMFLYVLPGMVERGRKQAAAGQATSVTS
jgi:Domain of unknown function (DUF4145)